MSSNTTREWKALAGIAAVMFGVGQVASPFVDIFPMATGGLIAVIGGIVAVSQVEADRNGETA